jgi:aspartyl-tRNA(Asn)/glutamyl-tRNA(Gln) amidotransferase subunit C
MILSDEEVRHIAQLARLQLNPEEVGLIARQMNEVLLYMEKLNELDTAGVEPTSHALHLSNAFREDQVQPSLPAEESLAIAPEQGRSAFVVPKVI